MGTGAERMQLNGEGKITREASFELLRIIAMCMIISLHYLSKGNVLVAFGERDGMNAAAVAAWIVEALCLVAVNVYVLISGYFGVRGRFRLSKLFRLWGTVVFYSLSITFLLGITGNLSAAGVNVTLSELTIYDWMNVVFPVVTEEYWFITAYLILYLCMPFLNAGMEKLSQKNFRNILICLLLIFSVAKSVLPMELPTDEKGYDVIWFICLYLLGGYFRLYGCRIFAKKRRAALLYILSALAMAGAAFGARYLYFSKGILTEFVEKNYFYTYNHIFCLLSAAGLFGLFTKISIGSGKAAGLICKGASCTLAVYLIHEQLYMRYLWPEWFGAENYAGKWGFLPHMFGTVLILFIVCVLIEYGRKKMVQWIWRIGKRG